MECFFGLLVFGVIAILVNCIGLGVGPSSRSRLFQQLVRRFGGFYQRGGVFRRPSVRFRYGSALVTIQAASRHGVGRTTQAIIPWPDATLDVLLEPRAGPSPSSRPRLPEVASGDPAFDLKYVVSGAHEGDVKRLLSNGVRWQVNRLHQLLGGTSLRVSIRNARLVIEKAGRMRRWEELEQFVQLALEFHDQAILTRDEGIEFLADNEAQLVEEPICRICGEPIVGDMVFCRRCRTPHHLDCWEYNGSCSTYGCRETRYAVPTIAQPLDPSDTPNGDT
ncbi:MAG: hypothetical protein FJ276_06130 [Planctomycetes bacterium]|nr:hypothetical protein [Planctomycetota bacterium]